jgi:hypothetical protein
MMNWWTARAFIPLAAILCVGAGLALARTDWARVLVVTGILAVISLPAHREVREPDSRGIDPRELAAILERHGEAGDTLLVARPDDPADPLGWAARRYLGQDARFRTSAAPGSQRWWTIEAEPECAPIRSWTLRGGGTLTLCGSPA